MSEDQPTEQAGRDLLYERIADRIRRDIVAGFYPRGTYLPSEADLCSRFGVSRGTLRRALADLASLGLVRPQPGVGHRVAGRLDSNRETENDLVAVLASCAEGGAYFARMVGGLERLLADAGLNLMVCSTDERSSMTFAEVLAAQVERLLHMRPRAVLFSMQPDKPDPEHLRAFSRAGIPVFQIDQEPTEPVAGFVGFDERLGGLIVTDWLIRWSGGVVASVLGQMAPGVEQRLEGYTLAVAGHGLPTNGIGEIRIDTAEDAVTLANELTQLPRGERLSLFCASADDLPALSQAIEHSELTIGEQVAVGCVLSPTWRVPEPPIPLVAAEWSAAEVGEAAASLIVHWLSDRDVRTPRQHLVAPRLAPDAAYASHISLPGTIQADVRR